MKNFPILVFDSGIGGLGTLCAMKSLMPHENVVYVAEFLHSPYGNRNKKEITSLALETLHKLCDVYFPKCIVIACNTLTATAIEKIRKDFCNILVVGCEPAVKLAIKDGKKNVLVLCTKATKKYSKYLKQYSSITTFSPRKLAGLVDDFYLEKEKILPYLHKTLNRFSGRFDACVLGCTHYALLKEDIKSILGCEIFDGNKSIAKHVQNLLEPNVLKRGGRTLLISTKKEKQLFLENCYKKMKGEKLCVE